MSQLQNRLFKRWIHAPINAEEKKKRKTENKEIARLLFSWLDVFLLLAGMFFMILGFFLVLGPIGYIVLGGCLVALAFFVANKQAQSGAERR